MKQHITCIISQYFGMFASKEFSPWFQRIINYSYVSLMGLDMSDFHIPSLNKRLNLFIENERVVLACETQQKKPFYMVLIGALNVGKMQISFDSNIQTNASKQQAQLYKYENLHLQKGDDFGCFEMGSTIIIISEPDLFDLKITAGQTVRFGQNVARLK